MLIDNSVHDWGNYVLCGYKAIVDGLGDAVAKGLNYLVDGNVPSVDIFLMTGAFNGRELLMEENLTNFSKKIQKKNFSHQASLAFMIYFLRC